ncbi:MAG: class I SAM-dependent methyltransferase [Bacteroidota bacterium]
MKEEKYHPEGYWTKVGERIEERENGKNIIAGDDEPYYRYKRKEFLKLLNEIEFKDKSVLEIGNGPGGNLIEIYKHKPSRLTGVDISEQMVKLARNKVPSDVEIIKIDGTRLPFKDREFDIVITATVLQHNTDENMLKKIMGELARVSKTEAYLFERIESEIKGDELCLGRPITYYEKIMRGNGFELVNQEFINIRTSYYISGSIRKGLNSKKRKEGERINKMSEYLQKMSLPLTRELDKIFKSNNDICRMEYKREK